MRSREEVQTYVAGPFVIVDGGGASGAMVAMKAEDADFVLEVGGAQAGVLGPQKAEGKEAGEGRVCEAERQEGVVVTRV